MPRATTTRRRDNLTADQVLADQVRALRTRRDLSQQALADKMGVKQSTIARMESGRRGLTVSELLELSAALDVAPIELLSASFAPSLIPIRGQKLERDLARDWMIGIRPLPDGDARAYWENVGDDEVAIRRDHPGVYLLRFRLGDYERAAAAENLIDMDAALDTLEATAQSERKSVEQRAAEPSFWRARQQRRGS